MRRPRRGLTLLEVLVAVFVLLFGLLAVIALVPVGALRMNQALQADRASAVAQCALEEVKVRGALDSNYWVYPVKSGTNVAAGSLPTCASYAIDPYFIAKTTGSSDIADFDTQQCNQLPYGTAVSVSMPRVTFANSATPPIMSLAAAERIFVSHDDLLVDTPEDPAARCRLLFTTTSGTFTADPAQAGVRQIDGQYSWLATVSPDASDPLHKTVSVSVAVFHNRDLSLPVSGKALDDNKHGERVVTVDISGAVVDQQAVVSSVTLTATGATSPEDYLAAVPGEWMLLCYDDSAGSGNKIFRWYRIVAVGDVDTTNSKRELTLAGPDWKWGTANVFGALFTNLVMVRTETVEAN